MLLELDILKLQEASKTFSKHFENYYTYIIIGNDKLLLMKLEALFPFENIYGMTRLLMGLKVFLWFWRKNASH